MKEMIDFFSFDGVLSPVKSNLVRGESFLTQNVDGYF